MKRTRGKTLVGLAVMFMVLLTAVGAAQSEDIVLNSHYGFSGVITKIESGMLFVKTDSSLQPRTISPNKADRVGLYNAKVGDPVNMLVDSGNVLIDASATDQSPDHVFVVGTVRYADPFWHEIQLSTPEGTTTYEVDSLAGTKLSGFADGAPVTLELDADNVMIDIQRGRSR
ncbi:MAG TPA: hypothetical protein VFX36_08850 [Nitrospira sp.]|jgi:hypothetical protein|nr:hypothetical protein [Nitrospira sp.]